MKLAEGAFGFILLVLFIGWIFVAESPHTRLGIPGIKSGRCSHAVARVSGELGVVGQHRLCRLGPRRRLYRGNLKPSVHRANGAKDARDVGRFRAAMRAGKVDELHDSGAMHAGQCLYGKSHKSTQRPPKPVMKACNSHFNLL